MMFDYLEWEERRREENARQVAAAIIDPAPEEFAE
jgi:hypothetical protein